MVMEVYAQNYIASNYINKCYWKQKGQLTENQQKWDFDILLWVLNS